MFKKIAIVGLGLMGGSLAAACRRRFPRARIVGITRDPAALKWAKNKKWIQEGSDDVTQGAMGADAVILCTPVDTFLPILKKIDRVCKKGALVMDVGSVKAPIAAKVDRMRWKNIFFVGCHPMVGSHERGVRAADPSLYDQGLILLMKNSRTRAGSLTQARRFWGRFSQRIIVMSPVLHDHWIGQISHLPHAVAACLVHAVATPSLKFAASGFRDATRIAASAPSLWQPIFRANREVLLAALSRFEKVLGQFRKKLQARDPKGLVRFLEQAQKKRQTL